MGGEIIMSMSEWAKREVEIACKRKRDNASEGWADYGCACYESALKAFNSLMGDGHSGMSIGLTKNILNRLIDGKPLTPVEDTDNIWNETGRVKEYKTYQCKRMSSLFKYVYDDGTVRYSDIDRFICRNIDSDVCFYSGLVRRLLDKMYPITMPYNGEVFEVTTEDILVDPKNGDYDTVAVHYMFDSKNEMIQINRFFTEDDNSENGWREITAEEWFELKKKAKGE